MNTPADFFRGLLGMALVVSAIHLQAEENPTVPQPPVVYRAPEVLWSRGNEFPVSTLMAASTDRSIIATALSSGLVKLWRATNFSEFRSISAQPDGIVALAFSMSGELLYSAGQQSVAVWQVTNGMSVRSWTEGTNPVAALAISPDDTMVATASGTSGYPHNYDGAVRIWNAANGTLLQTLTNDVARVNGVAFSPDGQHLIASTVYGGLFLWRVSDFSLVWSLPDSYGAWQSAVVFSPNSQHFAYGAGAGWSYVGVRRVADGGLVWLTNAHSDATWSLAYSPNGNTLVSTGSRTLYCYDDPFCPAVTTYPSIIVWNPTNGARVTNIYSPSPRVSSVAFTADGTGIFTAESTDYGFVSTQLRLWSLSERRLLRDVSSGHDGSVTAAAASPDGTLLATAAGDFDRTVRLWRASDGTALRTLSGPLGTPRALAFSPDNTRFACSDLAGGNSIKVWRVLDGAVEWSHTVYGKRLTAFAFSSTEPIVALAESGEIQLRNAANGVVTRSWTTSATNITLLGYTPDGLSIASLGEDNIVRFWQTSDGALLRQFPVAPPLLATFSPNGAILALALKEGIRLVRTSDGAVLRSFGSPWTPQALRFATDGQTLMSAGFDISLWNVADGHLIVRYNSQVGSPKSLAVSPRGDWFAYGRQDSKVLMARWPSYLQASQGPAAGTAELRFNGAKGTSYVIESSADLIHWTDWTNITYEGTPILFDISSSPSTPQLFYRARGQ